MNKVSKLLKVITDAEFRRNWREERRLYFTPRYQETTALLLGKTIRIPDSHSFLFMKKEIFDGHLYKFRTDTDAPFIIDGGANIGLASIYFKTQFPDCSILAFEADPYIASFLKNNAVDVFGLKNLEISEKALWKEDTTLNFSSERADSGRIGSSAGSIEVPAVRLSSYLDRPVDFLKLDIEGAESAVIAESESKLANVKNIFIEYHSFEGQEQTLPELLGTLKRCGFRLHITAPGLVSQSPLWERNIYNNMDFQINIFGFRA